MLANSWPSGEQAEMLPFSLFPLLQESACSKPGPPRDGVAYCQDSPLVVLA